MFVLGDSKSSRKVCYTFLLYGTKSMIPITKKLEVSNFGTIKSLFLSFVLKFQLSLTSCDYFNGKIYFNNYQNVNN